MSTLVIGGDSRLAKSLTPLLVAKGEKVYVTSRREGRVSEFGEEVLFLDLEEIATFNIPDGVENLVILGGVVDYKHCQNQYDNAFQVNCVNTPKLVERFLQGSGYVIYISTNTVFKFEEGLPDETSTPCPGFEYATLKLEAEKAITAIAERMDKRDCVSILRLTKNVALNTSPFRNWLDSLSQSQIITPFTDLFCAPILFSDSAHAISVLLEKKLPGVFHLSGEKDVSYAEFATKLCAAFGADEALVQSVSSADVGVSLVYNHPITALSMKYTEPALGLAPTQLDVVLSELIDEYRSVTDQTHDKR